MNSDPNTSYRRPILATLLARLREPRRFLQVVIGPRQVGKTTVARQAIAELELPAHTASADEPTLKGGAWIAQQWETARALRGADGERGAALLVLDEIQKITGWSETVKRLWDEDTAAGRPLHVLLLGSSPLLLGRGLTESLAGRFETIRAGHWSFGEMRDAFGWDLDTYIYFGGYPGSAGLIDDEERWRGYVRDALIETTIARDVMLTTRIDKPALFRRLFDLACRYSGRILSYQKMVGQLQDAGNTTTLAGYLDLLAGVGMVAGLQKYAGEQIRRRGSSPKLQVFNTALISAQRAGSFRETRNDPSEWGRLVESAVGAHLLNEMTANDGELYYWRERNQEVDFVTVRGARVTAIEVKSGRADAMPAGMESFARAFTPDRVMLVGGRGIPVEEFLSTTIGLS